MSKEIEPNGSVRASRSKDWIVTALLQLMEHTLYSDISIVQITDKAGVVRQTFYRSYKDKDEVLFACVTELFEQGLGLNGPAPGSPGGNDMSSERLFIRLFAEWKRGLPPALAHNIEGKDRKVRQLLYRGLDHCLDRKFTQAAGEETAAETGEKRYLARIALSSVIHVMLLDWTLRGFRLSPEEMGAMCFQLTASMREELERTS